MKSIFLVYRAETKVSAFSITRVGSVSIHTSATGRLVMESILLIRCCLTLVDGYREASLQMCNLALA